MPAGNFPRYVSNKPVLLRRGKPLRTRAYSAHPGVYRRKLRMRRRSEAGKRSIIAYSNQIVTATECVNLCLTLYFLPMAPNRLTLGTVFCRIFAM